MKRKIPDWRNPDDYKYIPGFLTEKEFYAWQFLRRNDSYRKDWEKELTSYLGRVKNKKSEKEIALELSFGVFPDDPKVAAKWGLWTLYDPDINSPYCIFNRRYSSLILGKEFRTLLGYPEELETTEESMVPDNKVAVVFEMKLPITPQIKSAQDKLIKLQKRMKKELGLTIVKNSKPHVSKWKDYLRIYDAYSIDITLDITFKEIANVIYPYDQNEAPDFPAARKVEKNYKAASELIGGKYKKDILIWDR